MGFRFFAPLLFLLALLGFVAPARATTIDPLTLEQMVSQASFVGIVECETAGGIVAEYRVIDSWKGAPAGTRFRLQTPFNYWEPQFPIALVGERSVVTAYADKPPTRIVSTTGGGGVPLWWRAIPYQYSLPLFQGQASVPDAVAATAADAATAGKTTRKYYALGGEFADFGQFRARVKTFLALSPQATEVALMRSIFDKYAKWRDQSETETAEIRELKAGIASATTADQLAAALLALHQKDEKTRVAQALASGGGAETLKFLASLTDSQWPLDKAERERVVSSIKARLDEQKSANVAAPPEVDEALPRPAAAELDKMRAVLRNKSNAKNENSYETLRAIETLATYDPAMVAQYLIGWENARNSWQDAAQGYVLGSYFAWRCGGERAVHLRSLDKAREPYIRVAGAVYLCFEDKAQGLAKLRELAQLPDDPGAWAALTLARRGDKSAMPRALQVFASAGESSMEGVPHRNLQKRLLVLLSNSAGRSHAPLPLADFEKPERSDGEQSYEQLWATKQHEHLQNWWKTQQTKIELHDPWLPLLEKQKVD